MKFILTMFSFNILCDLKDFVFRCLIQFFFIVLPKLVWNSFQNFSLTIHKIIMCKYNNKTCNRRIFLWKNSLKTNWLVCVKLISLFANHSVYIARKLATLLLLCLIKVLHDFSRLFKLLRCLNSMFLTRNF